MISAWMHAESGFGVLGAGDSAFSALKVFGGQTQARYMGLMSAGEIKALRQRFDLSQREMSEFLQIGAKSYTRWGSGRARPSRSMNVLPSGPALSTM